MTSAAPWGTPTQSREVLTGSKRPQASEFWSADEIRVLRDIRAAGGSIKPSKLHAMYLHIHQGVDVDNDFGHVLTYINKQRRASVPVDVAVGDRATVNVSKEMVV